MRKIFKKPSKINPYKYETNISPSDFRPNDERNYLRDKNVKFLTLINTSSEASVYYFEVEFDTKIYGESLPKGQYIIKFFNNIIKSKFIKKLLLLSDNNIIPKIFFINKKLIIMEFIEARDLRKLKGQMTWDKKNGYYTNQPFSALRQYIFSEIRKKLDFVHHELGFGLGDLAPRNILLDTKGKIYFIDPSPYFSSEDYLISIDNIKFDDLLKTF